GRSKHALGNLYGTSLGQPSRLGRLHESMTTILVSAPIANKPFNGGNAWTHLSYVLGFRKLGFDVDFVETIRPDGFVSEGVGPTSIEASVNRSYFRRISEQFGLNGKMALISTDSRSIDGVPFPELVDIAESAALLVNISGHLNVQAITDRVAC